MMIDRDARAKAAQLFRDFISGKITNDAFNDGRPQTEDRAIDAIWDTAWLLYDDHYEHRLTGKHRLAVGERRICTRWLLFLHDGLDYSWPDISLPGHDPAMRVQDGFWRRLLWPTGDRLSKEEADHFLATGHYAVWPFISVRDYRQALRHPRLLSGICSS